MELFPVPAGNFRIDGGAMFGVIPRLMWEKSYPPDKLNLVNLSLRCLLVTEGDRKILFDSGIGDKQDEKFLRHYYLNGEDTLTGSLKKSGFSPDDVTDHIITHLHFDHCGGSIKFNEDRTNLIPVFPNATYWISQTQWDLSRNPNRLESASFLKENIDPIEKSGQLRLFGSEFDLTSNIRLRIFNGHTMGLIVGLIRFRNRTLVNISDLIPMTGNIPLSWISGYDTNPLISIKEKEEFLAESLQNNYTYFFYHDPEKECCSLKPTPKGIRSDKSFTLEQFLSADF